MSRVRSREALASCHASLKSQTKALNSQTKTLDQPPSLQHTQRPECSSFFGSSIILLKQKGGHTQNRITEGVPISLILWPHPSHRIAYLTSTSNRDWKLFRPPDLEPLGSYGEACLGLLIVGPCQGWRSPLDCAPCSILPQSGLFCLRVKQLETC